ncbi:MAG: RluA family pseudouridine synthase [Myxococcales bacterium]|nr:RluA family pseudouridine synthase [Myxococcota bacterium]MDW8281612.1 RluA family pseudouridine synthase [Myxococcales bacterium]
MERVFTVRQEEAGQRLDGFLARQTGRSRAAVVRLIASGQVRVGGRLARKGLLLAAGDRVELAHMPADDLVVPPVPQPELPLQVLYEDAAVVAINKPVGLPSHPLRAGERGTVASALVARYPECASASQHPREGGLCHRLDTFTSGVLLAARTRDAWTALRRAFQQGEIDKEYLALVQGEPLGERGRIDLPLGPAPGGGRVQVLPRERAYDAGALEAHTEFAVERRGRGVTLLKVHIGVGRRHQIRAHLAYLGLPLYGDLLYGGSRLSPELAGQLTPAEYADAQGPFLHAARLALVSPAHGQRVVVEAALPPGRQRLLDLLLPGPR